MTSGETALTHEPGRLQPGLDRATALRVKLVCFDVDGVLTDGGIYLGDVAGQRQEFKRYDIQDGLGIKLLQRAGIEVALLTGRVSESVALRARELAISEVVQDEHARKLPALHRLLARKGIHVSEVAFVGDDLPDLAVLRVVGLPVVVANGSADAARVARVRLTRTGGHGAAREFCELLLRARGEWDALVEWYVRSRMEDVPA